MALADVGMLAPQGVDPKSPPDEHAMRISRALGGVTILQKNKEDIIATDTGSTVSPTRSYLTNPTDVHRSYPETSLQRNRLLLTRRAG